jgi:diguanylate cyclase (GGDEF)-like protein
MKAFRKLPVLVLVLALIAVAAVTLLETRADHSRTGQLTVSRMDQALSDLLPASFIANPMVSGPSAPVKARAEIAADEGVLTRGLAAGSGVNASAASLSAARAALASLRTTTARIYLSASHGLPNKPLISRLQQEFAVSEGKLSATLKQMDQTNAGRAHRARIEAAIGTALAMLALVAVFLLFYMRALRAQEANERLLRASRIEASTDALTALGNRRALTDDLAAALSGAQEDPELLLAMFDLNGFKQYNDTFGHGAGDALLARLGERLAGVVDGSGSVYRMGGDEFCLLARCTPSAGEGLLAIAAAALSDHGDGWNIDCSYGAAWLPSEARTGSDALLIADRRMYANKANRSSPSRQLTDVLLQVLSEQDEHLDKHVSNVSALAASVAGAFGLPEHEQERIRRAAALHDVGKTAIPSSVLNKPGPLDESEWGFVHRHTLIGERIVLAAPALANTAPLIRSSHERLDGAGYPDGLVGEQIPIGSRIIAVCDAYDAMTAHRTYRAARTADAALEELRSCAGSQFDPEVVAAFCAIVKTASHDPRTSGFVS